MLKRTWAIVLSLVMLVTLCPTTSVFAENAASKPTAIVENFEGKTLETMQVTSANSVPNWEIVQNAGNGGGAALKVSSLNNTAAVCIGSSYAYATDAAILEYDIQISKAPTTSTSRNLSFGIAGCNYQSGANAIAIKRINNTFEFWSNDSSANSSNMVKQSDLNIGEWYRVISTRIYSTATAWVLNSAGDVVAYHERTGLTSAQPEFCLVRGTTNSMDDGEILIDNIRFNQFNAKTYGPSVTSSSIANGAQNVLRNSNSITITTDSQIVASSMGYAKLTSASGDIVTCTMARAMHSAAIAPYAAGEVPLPLAYTITWSKTLNASDVYTLDLTKTKNRLGGLVDSTGVISFTTEEASLQETVLTDNFEDNTTFATDKNGYTTQYKGAFLYSDLNGAYKVEGYPNTGNALKFMYTNDAYTRTRVYTATPYVFGDNETYVFTYRVKISNPTPVYDEGTKSYTNYMSASFGGVNGSQFSLPTQSNTGAALTINANGEHSIFGGTSTIGTTEQWFYSEDTWYNVVYSVNKNGFNCKFIDVNNGATLYEYSRSVDYSSASGYYITLACLFAKDATKGINTSADAFLVVDDVSMWKINTSKANHALTASDTANANTVTLSFNQPTMVTADMLAVSEDSEGNTPVEADIAVKYTDFNTNVVTISGLDYGKTYYLAYDAVTSAGGAGFDPDGDGEPAVSLVQFTMPAPTASIMDKAAFVSGNVTLDYWNMDGNDSATFIAAFYKGTTLVDVALLANKALSANRNSVSFAAANVPADADGMIVYALNSLGNLVPLCVPTAKVAIN